VGSIALASFGLVLLAASARTRVTLIIDGETRTVATLGRTVGAALRTAGLSLESGDVVVPGAKSPLPASGVIELRRARPVTIEIDGETIEAITATDAAENILAESGTKLFPGDRVWIDGLPATSLAAPLRVASRIRVDRAFDLDLDESGAHRTLRSAAATVGEALWEAGITLRGADVLRPGAGAGLPGSSEVVYLPAQPVEVEADGDTILTWAAGDSVGEVLANSGVALVGLDYAVPDAGSPVPQATPIRVVRVTETSEFEGDVLPFETRWEGSDEIEIDRQGMVDPGQAGLQGERTRVRYEAGVETERMVEAAWTAVEPRDRIMGYGTKIVIRTLDTPAGPVEYWRAVSMYATSYSPCRSGVPQCLYGTASGAKVQKGIAAVTVPMFLDMRGQVVYVPGYGKATIGDTGGGIPGRLWIDLAYSDEDYFSWHNWVTVYFLTPVPPYIDYILE
ncbi:MAG TPA: ubiquitin-like domain-containing protein, partial [Anaerolineales bacterium]|nr:ubiquitin-like domain-containing protein [Anaerolineales bacterium]